MKKYVLVTGGAGYVGSHACKALHQAGYIPVTFDNLVYGHKWACKWGPFFLGDLNDSRALDQVFSEYAPVAVQHFAAFAYVGESVLKPGEYYSNNLAGAISLLEAMRRHNCSKIVFSSSCATYGVPDHQPIREDSTKMPINPYGWSKLMVEQILKDYERAYGMKHFCLRYFNAAGADPEGEIGELHRPETHLIPLAIQAALGQIPSVKVMGIDYPTPDGSAIRDYIHVTDLAQAHLMAMEMLLEKGKSISLNLGTGQGSSVREIIGVVQEVAGRPVPLVETERRPGDPPELVSCADLAGELLGWNPRFHDIKNIIETAWNWHANHLEKYLDLA